MSVKAATVERAVEDLITAFDHMVAVIMCELRYPLDEGMRKQSDAGRAQLREALIKLLMLIEVID
jgi:hypothetical protein